MGSPPMPAAEARLSSLLERRTEANRSFFTREADTLARCCERIADRFRLGGRLVALGGSPAARSDARHVAVEFVHPVIVGKRALPALAIGDPREAELVAGPDDVMIGFGL